MVEEIRGITWDLEGEQLDHWQAAQRLYKAGFTDAKVLATMWAVLEAESGGFLRAWHHNVVRNADGTIFRSEDGLMEVKSTDLGFIQKNVVHNPRPQLHTSGGESRAFVHDLFDAMPELANGQESAEIAFALYQDRGFQPWYAHSNGNYKRSLPRACVGVANFLDKVLNGTDGHRIGRK